MWAQPQPNRLHGLCISGSFLFHSFLSSISFRCTKSWNRKWTSHWLSERMNGVLFHAAPATRKHRTFKITSNSLYFFSSFSPVQLFFSVCLLHLDVDVESYVSFSGAVAWFSICFMFAWVSSTATHRRFFILLLI